MHIRTGDTVVVIRGEQLGERGEVQRVLRGRYSGRMSGKPNPNDVRIIVAGVNLITKHQRRTGNVRTQTGRIEREAPIHISNVMLVCPHCGEPTRVGHQILEDGTKVRQCKNEECRQTMD
ncbi:MAG: 50S ribosomal protein L24 [Caldilineae bacterium]|nr:50S ribosomal protein L24 [Anaerolineae bacterium]MCB0198863.1 50S ribosomal protein L24 [Anaerolineae bacterium]MCB0203326.1 50S ribosomal protein L24 [Anaerolineae bacterium]MCB0252857.1 50S ribosomal protein L24 [Anaerolineae bacterium]MCB9153540.1 50S ribosomal protein L24 [Caldilineae bacterium]